jgi:hypothetical protein
MAFRRGAAEVTFLRECHQVFELAEMHLAADQACGYREYDGKLPYSRPSSGPLVTA